MKPDIYLVKAKIQANRFKGLVRGMVSAMGVAEACEKFGKHLRAQIQSLNILEIEATRKSTKDNTIIY